MPLDIEQTQTAPTPHLPESMFHRTSIASPSSSQNLFIPSQDVILHSPVEDSFTDGSDMLFSLYNEKAAEYDQKLADNWKEDARGVMLLSGLLSATIAGFLAQSYLGSQTTSQDVSAFYLSQIYQLQIRLDNSTTGPSPPIPPIPASPPTAAHSFWFAGLVLSLATAVFATLVQEWVRKYLFLTQPRLSPHRRARIRSCMTQDGSLVSLQLTVCILHRSLHISIFLFFLGLIALTSSGPVSIILNVNFEIFCFLTLYLKYSLMPHFHPHSIYSTPFSRFLFSLRAVPQLLLSLFRAITSRGNHGLSGRPREPRTSFERDWLKLDCAILEVEKVAEAHSSTLDVGAISWLLTSLGQDRELEQFLASIPGFYTSKRVEDPAKVLRVLNGDRLPKAIVSFMDRTLSSQLFSDITIQKRIGVSLKAMETDHYLLQRTFYHVLCSVDSPIFERVDFVLLADRYTGDASPNVCFLAKCIVAVAINRLEDHESDERWSGIVQRRLNWSQPCFAKYCGQPDSIRLRNLIQIIREFGYACPSYDHPPIRAVYRDILSAARQLNVENASHQLRLEFCELWNQLVGSTQDPGQDPVNRSNAMRLISLTRSIYISLHKGTESGFAFAASADDLDSASWIATLYPLRTISSHRLSPRPVTEQCVIVAHGDQEAHLAKR